MKASASVVSARALVKHQFGAAGTTRGHHLGGAIGRQGLQHGPRLTVIQSALFHRRRCREGVPNFISTVCSQTTA